MATITFDALKYVAELEESGLVTKNDLKVELSEVKHELLKWIFGISIAQTALILAVLAFFK